jgi:hypothetical protein
MGILLKLEEHGTGTHELRTNSYVDKSQPDLELIIIKTSLIGAFSP